CNSADIGGKRAYVYAYLYEFRLGVECIPFQLFVLVAIAAAMRSSVRPSSFTVIFMTTFALMLTFFKMFGNRQQLPIPSITNVSLLSSNEIKYLSSFSDLLFLRQVSHNSNEIIFASYDTAAPTSLGRLKIFRIENSSINDYIKFYSSNNEVRAINGLLTEKSILGGLAVNVPLDIDEFQRKWHNGRFIECIGLNLWDKSLKPVIDKTFVKNMAKFRDFIENYGTIPFLFGGTLLGWS
uniref:Fukutin n=1 Tax=Parascaris univalens TaxID=6257 RepID=A0A914ZW93_PARUN